MRSARAKRMAANSSFSGTSLNDMRNNVDGIELAYQDHFRASGRRARPASSRRRSRKRSSKLKALVEVPDLKSLDPEKLRAASEELIVVLQTAAPEIGLRTPTLEEIVSDRRRGAQLPPRESLARAVARGVDDSGAAADSDRRMRRAFPGARQADGPAGRNRAQRRCACTAARGLQIGGDRRHQILSGQSRRSGVQLPDNPGRRGAAGRHQLQHLPRQWRLQSQILHSRACRRGPARSTRRAAVQPQGRQRRARSGHDPEPARRALPGALRS